MESHEKRKENVPDERAAEQRSEGAPSSSVPPNSPSPEGSSTQEARPEGDGEPAEALSPEQRELRERVIEILRTVYDPEIPVNIHELGMIYEVTVRPSNEVHVRMTLTSPMCPVAGTLPGEVECKVAAVEGVSAATVDLVWDPPWNPSMMSEAARLQLNL